MILRISEKSTNSATLQCHCHCVHDRKEQM